MARVVVMLGLMLVALVRAEDPYVCTNTCSFSADQRPGITYVGGQQYKYEYVGEVISKTRVTADEESKMTIKAEVILTARTECDQKLQVLNVMVEDAPEEESKWFKEAVEKYDMHYSYQDGWVEYLCPHDEEDVAATNFKRGILSALQTTVTNVVDQKEVVVQESDVSGECDTRYQITGSGDLVFNKTKVNCRHNSHLPYLPHQQYASEFDETNLPFFRSEENCKMELSQGVWKSVECKEEIEVEAPFSASTDASTMAALTVTSTLTLQSGPEPAQGNFTDGGHRRRRESLRMDLPGAIESSETRTSNVTDVLEQIGTVLDQLFKSVGGDASAVETRPYAFSNLLGLMDKVQDQEDMAELWEANFEEESRRQFMLDALMLCESHHCMRLLANVSQGSPEVMPGPKVITWLMGSHFFTKVHSESINIIMELVNNMEDVKTQALMAASTMVHKMCQQEPNNCRVHAKPFLEYIEDQVDDSCGYGKYPSQREDIRVALRALSNAGIRPNKQFSRNCYSDKKVVPSLRVGALQTYRRSGCPSDPKTVWKILKDQTDNVEVRLAAYISLVPCAINDPKFFTHIEHLLLADEVNQVGSYIWTHIQNLVDQPGSTNYHQELSRLAAHHTLQAKFNTNAFRSSRNYRYAHFSEIINMGGSAESNVIFSPESYIPQQASVNFTLEMLEKSINLFEFGGDFSGLEEYVERFFGKDGYFKNEEIQTLLKNMRPKRDIREEKINEFQRLYDEAQTRNELDEVEIEEAKASLYLRIFGNEVFYVDNIMRSNPMEFLRELALGFSKSPKSFKVIDQEYVSTTQLGFPLRLKVNATGSVSFTYENNHEAATEESGAVYEMTISASGVLACDESLMVDGYGSWSGIRRRSSKTLVTDFGGRVEFGSIQPIGVQVKLPKPDVAKISSSVTVALYKNSKQGWQDEWPSTQMGTDEYCSPELTSRVLGLEMCAKSSFGTHTVGQENFKGEPYSSEFTIAKTDTFAYYQFYFKIDQNIFEAIYEAPGTSIERKIRFLVNLGPGGTGGYIVIRGMGYGLEGQYQNTDTLRELSLKYVENSTTKGGIEMSLQSEKERSGFKYIPKVVLTIGPDVFSAEGNLAVNQVAGFRSSWGLEGTHQKVDGRMTIGQSFGSVDGSLNIAEEATSLQLHSEYGTDRAKAHSITLNLDLSNDVEHGKKKMEGHLFLESTQGESNLTLNYEYSPGDIQANGSVTILGKEVSSQIVMKNLDDDEGKDFQVTFSLVSPQLDMEYLGQAVYKVSDNAFQTEAEINLGSAVHAKAAFTYLYEYDPLLFLTGIHLSYNEHLFQAETSIDLSQPGRTQVTLSGDVGLVKAGFFLQSNHAYNQPFNTTLNVQGKYDDQEIGLTTSVSSDEDWELFTGSTKVKWFDKNFTLKHEVDWKDDFKSFSLTAEDYGVMHIMIKTTPQNPFIKFLVHSTEEIDDNPDFQFSVGMLKEGTYQLYQANITTGSEPFFATSTNLTSDQEFSSSLTLLASELMIMGHYSKADYDDFQGSAEINTTLPSGDAYSTKLDLNYSYDGTHRNLEMSSSYGDELIESKLSILHHDGWFSDDSSGANFTLNTPFNGLKNIGFSFGVYSDSSETNFAEITWETLKLHGLVHADYPKKFETTLQYGDGGTCDSHFSIYHNADGHQLNTGAILSLTQDMNPWAFEVNTSMKHDYYEKSLELELSVQSPMLEGPFDGSLRYNLTKTKFDFEFEAGSEEKVTLSLASMIKEDENLNKFLGTIEMDSPWNEPVMLNVTGSYDYEHINILLDVKSTLPFIQSLTVESIVNFIYPGENKVHFQLNHEDVQILMGYHQKLSRYGFTHDLEGSVNTFTITYDLKTEWDYYYRPKSAEGKLSLLNLDDHNLEVSLSLKQESGYFVSEVSGLWDEQSFKVGYTLDYKQPLEWSHDIEVVVPGYDDMIKTNVSLNALRDSSQVDLKVHFNSPWTEEYQLKFLITIDNDVKNYDFEFLQASSSLFKMLLETSGPIDRDMSRLHSVITSAFFENTEVTWQHNVRTENLVSFKFSYGSDYYLQGKSHLKMTDDWFNQQFESYSFSANVTLSEPKVLFATVLDLDSSFVGDFSLQFNEYSALFKSDFFKGKVFQAEATILDKNYKVELVYEKGRNKIPDINFKVMLNEVDLVSSKIKFNSVYPQLDAVITLIYANEDNSTFHSGNLMITANLDYGYGIKGTAKLLSDFEGYENHTISIDTQLNIKESQIGGFLIGHLQMNDNVYNAGVNASLQTDKKILFELGVNYDIPLNIEFKKIDAGILFTLTRQDCILKTTLILDQDSPPWELLLEYKIKNKKLNGHMTLGDATKYDILVKLDSKILHINTEITDEDGSSFKVLQGNINWNIRKDKQQINMNMNSDYSPMTKMTGQLTKRGLASTLKLTVNEEKATAQLRLVKAAKGNPGKLYITIENNIYKPLSTVVDFEFSNSDEGFKTDLTVDVNEEKGWMAANLNIGLPESYLRFKTPFEEFNKFNLTINAETAENYSLIVTMEVPQFCFSFEAMLDTSFQKSSIAAAVQLECSDSNKYEFIFKHNVDFSAKEPLGVSTKLDLNGYTAFEFDGSCEIKGNKVDFKVEGKALMDYGLGTTFTGSVNQEGRPSSINLRIYDPSSNSTHFQFEMSIAATKTQMQFELLQDNTIMFQAEYDLAPKKLKLASSYSHSLFGHPLSINFTCDGSFTRKSGTLELHLTTDKSYDTIDLSAAYDLIKDINEATFNLSTPSGNATVKGTYEATKNSKTLIIDMLSSLHTFQDYHYEVVYKQEGSQSLKLVSAQDDTKFEFLGDISKHQNIITLDVNLETPFQEFETLNLTFVYPHSSRPEDNHKLHLSVFSNGEFYVIDLNQNYTSSWKTYGMKIDLFTPYDAMKNITIDFNYNLEDHISLSLDSRRGRLSVGANWNILESHLNFTLLTDLSYFNQGEYVIDVEIPFDISHSKGFKFIRQKSSLDFDFQIIMGENYRNGSFSLVLVDQDPDNGNLTYLLQYSNDGTFKLRSQFGSWEAMLALELYGYPYSLMAGKFEINTNFQNYESFEGNWDINNRGSMYKAEIQIDVNKEGVITFDGTLDTQAHSVATPWDSVKLDILFESPFTKSHHFHAEYQLQILTLSASYKYGLDTFYINAVANIHSQYGTVTIMGKLPIYGFSSIDIRLTYTIAEQNSVNLMISVEETTIEIGFVMASRGFDGSFKASLISPYFNPLGASLAWAKSHSGIFFEIKSYYGAVKGSLKMTLKYTETFADFEIEIVPRIIDYFTHFRTASRIAGLFKYDLSDVSKMYASVVLTVDDHVIEAKADLSVRKAKASLNFIGLVEFLGITANVTLEAKKSKDSYQMNIYGDVTGLKPFSIHINGNIFQIQFSWEYNSESILDAKFSYDNANIVFSWDKYNYFNLTGHSNSLKNGHEFGLSFINHNMQTINLQASYLQTKGLRINFAANSSWTEPLVLRAAYLGNQINLKIKYGEKEYNVDTKFIFHPAELKANVNIRFDSTDDPLNPININAYYDLKEFMNGDMKSLKNLTHISFEWREKMDFLVRGLRKPNNMEIVIEVNSPFKYLPKLSMGAGWEFINNDRHFLLDFNSNVEWSKNISLSGLTKISKDLRAVDVKWSLNTPFSSLEELTVGVLWKKGCAEALFSYNNNKWKLSCDYTYSPFSCILSIETPITGFEIIKLTISIDNGSKLKILADLTWPGSNTIGIQISFEYWKLEVALITPWSPFKNLLFFTSLKTESEEALLSATLQWDGRRTEMTLALSNLRYEFSGKYFIDTEEIGTVKAAFAHSNQDTHFEAEIKTPYDIFETFNVVFDLSPRGFSFKFNINDLESSIEGIFTAENIRIKGQTPYLGNLSVAMEANTIWTELATYATFTYSDNATPFNVSFTYKLEDDPFSFKSVFKIKADETWMSVVIDFEEDFNVTIDIFENCLELKLMVPRREEINFHVHFESKDLRLESMSFDISCKYGGNFEFLNITSTLAFKLKDQFLSRHELVIQSNNDRNYISTTVELYSDYLSDPYVMKSKIPLSDIFTYEGEFDVSLSQGGKQMYRLFYETVSPNRWSSTRHLMIKSLEWEANLKTILSEDSLNVSFSYPKPTTEHTFFLTWTDVSLERFSLGAEITSPYLDEGEYKFDLKFSVRGNVHMKLESELIFGTKKTVIKGLFHYNERQHEVRFEIQVMSDLFGNHFVEFNIDWEREILITGKLLLQEKEHSIKLTIDTENYTLDLVLSSPFLPQDEVVINGKLEQSDPSYTLTGKYTTSQTEINFIGDFRYVDIRDFVLSAKVLRNDEKIFEISASFFKENNIKCTFDMQSIIKELNTNFKFEYKDTGVRIVTFNFANSFFHIDEMRLSIKNSKDWTSQQRLYFVFNEFDIFFESALGPKSSKAHFFITYVFRKAGLSFEYEDFGRKANIYITSPFAVLEVFSFGYEISDAFTFVSLRYQRDGDEVYFLSEIRNDDIVGKGFVLELQTPFKGYERFAFYSPQFNREHEPSFIVMIEYPSGKIGIELVGEIKGLDNTHIKILIWLPFEELEIISLQCVNHFTEVILEARVGKFGFTVSLQEQLDKRNAGPRVLLRVNEHTVVLTYKEFSTPHQARVNIHIDIKPHDWIWDFATLDFELRGVYRERLQVILRSNQEEYLNLHFGWDSHKVLTIATPKWYPGFVHINFETTAYLDDYRVEVGLAPGNMSQEEGESWDIYGFQVHQDILKGGRHMRISGEVLGGQFSVGGTVSMDSLHFNKTLIFELNKKKIGYEFLFKKHPGFMTDKYIEDISMILPNQTVHWNTSLERTNRQFDLTSMFTWNEYDSEMPPIILKVTYDDKSLFDEKEHALTAVFYHPENELITFQGNLTKLYDTPLIGLGELIDGNVPEQNIIMNFNLDPVTEEGEQNMQLNVSQPFSNFSLTFEAQVMNSIFNQAEYALKYWSLSKERMEEVSVSTNFTASENQCNFVFDVQAPEYDWGYNYEGAIYDLESTASFSLQGTSKEFSDFWMFGTTVNKHLPEIEMKLEVGQEYEDAFETGRLRLGLHNPLEMGAILDHQRFGVWDQDGRVGLNLRAQSVLQLLFEYDPSLDYLDDDFVARLTSPADQIWDAWLRDFNSTVSSAKDWGASEIPAVYKVMVNQDTVQAIWERESSNIGYLKVEFDTAISDMKEDFAYMWNDVLYPAWEATYNFFIEMYTQLLAYYESALLYLTDLYTQAHTWLTETWTEVETYFTTLFGEWSTWFMQIMQEQWAKIVEKYTLLVEYVTTCWTAISDAVSTAYNSAVEQLTSKATEASTYIQETAAAVQTSIQPFLDSILEAFTKYWEELSGIMTGKCWASITAQTDALTTSVQEMANAGITFFSNFLQLDEFYNRFVEIKDKVIEWATQLWTNIEGMMTQLQQSAVENWQYLTTVFGEGITQLQETYNALKTKIETDGFYAYMEEKVTEVREKLLAVRESIVTFLTEQYEAFKTSATGNVAFDYVNAVAGNVYDTVMMVWNRWRHEERKDLDNLERIAFSIADAAKKLLTDKNYLLDELYVWQPEDYGRVYYNQLLPVKWNSFLETPKWHPITRIFYKRSPVTAAKRALAEGMQSIASGWEAFNLQGSLLPPFTATATIFGHHVTTFDLHHYQFLGSCTYLLTKDFDGNEFEIIGNYQRSDVGSISLKTLQIRAPNTDIHLGVDATYVVIKRGSAEVFSGGEYSAMKMDDLFVTCNKVVQGCSITVSGKYFGKLGGLLGNYNYEPSDDQAGPDGSYARHSAELGRMWAVSSETCYQGNQIIKVDDMSETDVDSCWKLFLLSSSSLSNCFYQVDPRPYFDHCIRGQNQPDFGQNIDKSPCDSVAAYRTQCSSQGIHLSSPDECQDVGGTCDVLGELVPSGWKSTFRRNTIGSADVAFVIEVANCNKKKDLISLLDILNEKLQMSGIEDVRYTLVTTNGNTMDITGTFVSAAEIATELRSLVMKGRPPGDGDAAVISAARKLRWRPGVSRNIIHLACVMCDSGDAIEQACRENDVTYHLLSRNTPKVEGLDKKRGQSLATKIFGYDEKFVYKSGDYRKLKGDADERELIVEIEGSCAKAALKTNGTFFNSLKWNPKKATLTTKFLNVVTQRVVQSSVSPDCQECRCSGRGTKATLICRKCSSWKADGAGVMQQEDETLKEEIKRNFVEFYQEEKAEES